MNYFQQSYKIIKQNKIIRLKAITINPRDNTKMIIKNTTKMNFTSDKFLPIPEIHSKKSNLNYKSLSFRSNPEQVSQLQNVSKEQKPNILPLPELLSRLSLYRSIKQIEYCMSKDNSQKLWRDSPCCLPYPVRNISVDNVNKFQIGSIYHKDNINQQKKVFTQFQKPELLLKNFKRQIQDASKSRDKNTNKNKLALINQTNNLKNKRTIDMRKTTTPLESKIYEVVSKVELKYDRNGSRSIFVGEYNVHEIKEKIRARRSNFTSSQRIDLGLPLNFNPGPGKYFNQKPDQNQVDGCYSYRQKRNSSIQKNDKQQQIQTERNRKY